MLDPDGNNVEAVCHRPRLLAATMDIGFGEALLIVGGLLAVAAALSGVMKGTVVEEDLGELVSENSSSTRRGPWSGGRGSARRHAWRRSIAWSMLALIIAADAECADVSGKQRRQELALAEDPGELALASTAGSAGSDADHAAAASHRFVVAERLDLPQCAWTIVSLGMQSYSTM